MNNQFFTNRNKIAPICPCGKSNRDGKFAPSKEDPNKGYCHSCLKFIDPTDNEIKKTEPKKEIPTDYHPIKLMSASFKNSSNKLVKFLRSKFDRVDEIMELYNVGSSRKWDGSTIFWQVDEQSNVRYGKVMLYDEITGKRVKEPFNHFTNIHTILKLKDFNHKQCLFGLHLVPNNTKPIAIVESEKTAIIMSLADNNYLWLATGGKGNFNYEMLAPLKAKSVTAFPDAGETIWNEISERLNELGFNIIVSEVLNKYPKGYDLADVLLDEIKPKRKNYEEYTHQERLLFGTQHFKKEDLKQLAEELFSQCKQMNFQPITDCLQIKEGFTPTDAEDLLDILCLQKILTVTDRGYILNN